MRVNINVYEAKKKKITNKQGRENVCGIDDWRIKNKNAPGYANDNGSNRSFSPRSPPATQNCTTTLKKIIK